MRFWRFFQRRASGNIARDRLKIVLVSDRANCSPAVIENIREDLLNVLAKYVEVDTGKIEIEITQAPDNPAGCAIPGCPGAVSADEPETIVMEKYDKAIKVLFTWVFAIQL